MSESEINFLKYYLSTVCNNICGNLGPVMSLSFEVGHKMQSFSTQKEYNKFYEYYIH